MKRLLLRAAAAHLRSARSLFALALLGVALGVASVVSIQILNRSALAAFEGSMESVSGDADLSILGHTPTIPESILPDVLSTPGVAAALPAVSVTVSVPGQDDLFLDVVGVDLLSPLRLKKEMPLASMRPALEVRGWVAISPSLSRQLDWSPGEALEVSLGTRRIRLTLGALVDFTRWSPFASRRMVVMDIAQAQHLVGRRGEIHQVDLKLREGAEASQVARRLQERLGSSFQILTPEQRQKQAHALLGAFRLNLTALSLISLFVGAFLVYSSTQAALVRRRSEVGVLRSLGATRGQVMWLILVEVGFLGALGVMVGVPLGYRVAAANVDTVSATLSNIYLLAEIESLTVPVWVYLLAGVIGVGGAVAGALLPAFDFSRRDPRALLAAFTLHEQIGGAAARLFLGGLAVLGVIVLLYLLLLQRWRPGGFAVGVAVLIALPLMTPFLVRLVCGGVRTRGFRFAYALRSLGLKLQTTSFTISALAVAVTMLIGITLMIGSFRRTLEIWIAETVQADVYVSTPSWRRARGAAAIGDEILRALERHPSVGAIDRLRQFSTTIAGRRISVNGVDLGLAADRARFSLLEGNPREVLQRARREGGVLVGEPLARRASVWKGDRLRIHGPRDTAEFPVAGVYYDYSSENGSVFMDLGTMEASFGAGPINNVALYLDPDEDVDGVVNDLRRQFAGVPLRIRSNRALREDIVSIFDQTFAVTRLLQVMSLLIAASGITLALLIMAREQISEIALYRALGAQRSQLFRVYLGKGLAMAAAGLVLGALGGVALALVLIFLINRSYFGWTIAWHWPWTDLARGAAIILAASFLASLYPALRASRTPASELSREDV